MLQNVQRARNSDAPRRVWRMAPCPAYDVEHAQSWLEDLASEGYFLCSKRIRGIFARFEVGTPRAVRYRLHASRRFGDLLDENPGRPEQPEIELCEACGWQYTAAWNGFAIYRSDDAHAPELNTDPQLQAATLGGMRRDAFLRLITSLFWPCVYLPLMVRGQPLYYALRWGFAVSVLGLCLCTVGIVFALTELIRLILLQRRLKAGKPLEHRTDWQRHARAHRISWFAFLALTVAAAAALVTSAHSMDTAKENALPLESYTEPLPFATLQDIAGSGEIIWDAETKYMRNRILVRSDPLAPVMLEYEQNATVLREDGTALNGSLYTDYYELRTPGLAHRLGKELATRWRNSNQELVPLSLEGVDEAWYCENGALSHLILVCDRRVAGIVFFTVGGEPTLMQAAPVFAQQFAQHPAE
ncbi:MAG: DUF2812 domain-containing protein [Gemmiger sp.]